MAPNLVTCCKNAAPLERDSLHEPDGQMIVPCGSVLPRRPRLMINLADHARNQAGQDARAYLDVGGGGEAHGRLEPV
jgi:hypothetical protein